MAVQLTAYFESAADTPLVTPATLPTIRVTRVSDLGLDAAGSTVEVGDGLFSFAFTPTLGENYTIRVDGDPIVAGQTIAGGRYATGSLSSEAVFADILTHYDNGEAVAIHFDSAASNTSSVFGDDGTVLNPVSDETAMLALVASSGIKTLWIRGILPMGAVSYDGLALKGPNGVGNAIVILNAAASVADMGLERLFCLGALNGTDLVRAFRCLMIGVSGFRGEMHACPLGSLIGTPAGTLLIHCVSQDLAPMTFDATGLSGSSRVVARSFDGDVQIGNLASAGAGLAFAFTGGSVEVLSTCSFGAIVLSGTATLVADNSGPGCTVDTSSLLPDTSSLKTSEIHQRLGLLEGTDAVHNPTSIVAGSIAQTVVTVGSTVTVSRDP